MENGYVIIFNWKYYFQQKIVPRYGKRMKFYIFNYIFQKSLKHENDYY